MRFCCRQKFVPPVTPILRVHSTLCTDISAFFCVFFFISSTIVVKHLVAFFCFAYCKNYSEKRNVLEKIQIKVWIFYEKKFPFKNILKSWFAMRCTFSTRNSLNVWMGKCIWLVHVASNGKIHRYWTSYLILQFQLINWNSFIRGERNCGFVSDH